MRHTQPRAKITKATAQRDEAKARYVQMTELYDQMVVANMATQLGTTIPHREPDPKRPRGPMPDPGQLEGASELRQLRHEVKFYTRLADQAAEKLGELIMRG